MSEGKCLTHTRGRARDYVGFALIKTPLLRVSYSGPDPEGLRERNILPETCRSRVSPISPGTLPFDDNHPTNGIGDILTIPFHRVSMHMPGGTSLLRESTSFLLRAPCWSATSAAAASR